MTSRIKHPNFTGYKKIRSGGYIPEWIVKTIEFNHEGGQILAVENQSPLAKIHF